MKERECECIKDDWTVFSGWLRKLNAERVTPGHVEFFVGKTLERLYRCRAGKDLRAGSLERVRRRVLKNRVLMESMAYWLRLLKNLGLSPKERRELTISFWVNTDFCLSHWWLAFNHVLRNQKVYMSDRWEEAELVVPEALKRKMEEVVRAYAKVKAT